MTKFTYTHTTPAAFTLSDGSEYHLHQGGTYSLPAENEYIKGLVEQGYLTPVKSKQPTKDK